MIDVKKETIEDWRELGFFYDYDKEKNLWLLVGSRNGLLNLSKLLKNYASKMNNNQLGEHEHLFPYSYLTIVTSEKPQITDYGIFGSLSDLLDLADIISEKLKDSNVGDLIQVGDEYSKDTETQLFLQVKEEDFDPSSEDKFLWLEKK
ncbi:MAG: hypothetical protein M3405_16365 [Acidobacteriota bacterium]|jgi:hypothetical protein|nr:hypothetical protein [Acidobacteriota bacterium]